MNYKKYFSDELTSLKSQGLYRKFRQINRNQVNFPKATERFEGKERAVEVWCSNDYLNLSQHPLVILESVKVVKELRNGFWWNKKYFWHFLLSCRFRIRSSRTS